MSVRDLRPYVIRRDRVIVCDNGRSEKTVREYYNASEELYGADEVPGSTSWSTNLRFASRFPRDLAIQLANQPGEVARPLRLKELLDRCSLAEADRDAWKKALKTQQDAPVVTRDHYLADMAATEKVAQKWERMFLNVTEEMAARQSDSQSYVDSIRSALDGNDVEPVVATAERVKRDLVSATAEAAKWERLYVKVVEEVSTLGTSLDEARSRLREAEAERLDNQRRLGEVLTKYERRNETVKALEMATFALYELHEKALDPALSAFDVTGVAPEKKAQGRP